MEKVIIKKSGRERIEVSVTEFKGRKFLDIRNYYRTEEGEWKPSPKGIMIPVESSKKVWRGIKKVAEPFFDLLPPPGDEAGAEKAALKKKAKVVEDDNGKPLKKKVKAAEASSKKPMKAPSRPHLDDDDEDAPKPKSLKKKKKLKKGKTSSI